jgi:hypothetical protein
VLALADPGIASRYTRAHGLCLRHIGWVPDGEPLRLVVRQIQVRSNLMHWELEEAGRKENWTVRHERRGDESTAWYRAAGLLDGRVFLGTPARFGIDIVRHFTSRMQSEQETAAELS